MRRIAFFDFDGTITNRDTFLEFIRYAKGDLSFISGFLLNSPVLIAFKIGVISNHTAKQWMLRYFFGSMKEEVFERLCEEFSRDRIPAIVRQKALNEIERLRLAGAEIVVISASPINWVKRWADTIGAHSIATRLEVRDNRISGRIVGRNCHGHEKVRRIRESYDLNEYHDIYCYGDTNGDKPMLRIGTIRFYQPFR